MSWITCGAASRKGLTAELMTRLSGFGSFGGMLTTFVIFAATEARILAIKINIVLVWDLPSIIVWYVFVAVISLSIGGIGGIIAIMGTYSYIDDNNHTRSLLFCGPD